MSKMPQLDSDRQQVERLTDVVPPPSFAQSARAEPTFIQITAPWQQDDELQVAAICIEALKRIRGDAGRQRVIAYVAARAGGL